MPRFSYPFNLSLVSATALLACLPLSGCMELDNLRQRSATQEETITQLRKENAEFQTAYYKIKEQMDKSLASSQTERGQIQIELDRAKNLRSQQEKDLADQLRTTKLEAGAYQNEAENQKALTARHIGDLEANVRAMSAERDAALAKLRESDNALRAEQQRSDALTKEVAALTVENKTRGDRLAQNDKDLAAAQAARTESEGKLRDLAQRLTSAQTEAKTAQERSAVASKQLDAAQSELQTARAEGAKAKTAEAERSRLATELDRAQKSAAAANLENDADLKTLAEKLKADVHGEGVQVRQGTRGLRLILPNDLAFEPNSVVLSERGKSLLTATAHALTAAADRSIKIEGHTDNQPVKDLPFADNWGLGSARADRVRDFLMQQGVNSDHIEAVTRGDRSPLGDNKTQAGRAQNRRIEIVIGGTAKSPPSDFSNSPK